MHSSSPYPSPPPPSPPHKTHSTHTNTRTHAHNLHKNAHAVSIPMYEHSEHMYNLDIVFIDLHIKGTIKKDYFREVCKNT